MDSLSTAGIMQVWMPVSALSSMVEGLEIMAASSQNRPRLLMLAAHEPYDDPRVDWAARTALKSHEVDVLGLHNSNSRRSDVEDTPQGYRIWRAERSPGGRTGLSFLLPLLAIAVRKKISRRSKWLLLLASPLAVVVLLAEIGIRFCGALIAMLWPRFCVKALRSVLSSIKTQGGGKPFLYRMRMFRSTLIHVSQATNAFLPLAATVCPKPSVIYCNDLDTLVAGVILKVRTGARLIHDSHEYWPHSNVEACRLHVRFFSWLEKYLIKHADAVITVSDPLAREMERVYAYNPVLVVPNAEPWMDYSGKPRMQGDLTRLANGRVSFLFQGNFAPQRGLEELIDAWHGVDATHAALFLRGPDNQWKDELQERARRRGLLNNAVYFLPSVCVEELIDAAREADVGVIPYKTDSPAYRFACPNKLSQYMQSGIALLSNNIGYVAQHIDAARCGAVYDCRAPETIVAAVEKLAGNRDLLGKFKSNSWMYSRDVFNWERQSHPLNEVLRTFAITEGASECASSCGRGN